MAEGLLALHALVPDPDVGPRSDEEEVSTQSHHAMLARGASRACYRGHRAGAKTVPEVNKSYFGFGPGR